MDDEHLRPAAGSVAPGSASPWTPAIRAFLDATRYAVVATIQPDGTPHQAVVWYRLDGDEIVLNSADGRVWPRNLRRDPRMAFMVEDELRYVSASGTVRIEDDQAIAQADIAAMARSYHADEPEKAETLIHDRFETQHRVSFRFRPARFAVDL